MIFNVSGGGGTALNFRVVGNPKPTNPKENCIWVNTDRINNYYFSATQPENMAEYDVWFPIGTSSTVAFSATKKNPIMVYPLSAKQMVSGALVDKTAKSWQNGKWADWWDGTLYDAGNEYTFVTGGWKAVNAAGASATLNSDGISFNCWGNSDRTAAIYTNDKVAINGRTLYVNVDVSSNNQSFIVGLSTQNTKYVVDGAVAQKQTSGTGNMTLEVPLSGVSQGEYYVFAVTYAAKAVVKKVWLG